MGYINQVSVTNGETTETVDVYDSRLSSVAAVASTGKYSDLSGTPTVDSALSATSSNAVANKAVQAGIAAAQSSADAAQTTASAKQAKHATATATLAVASWSSLTQQVAVTGVTASNTVIVSPAAGSTEAWGKAGVYASAQAAGKITFACKKAPTAALTANVVIFD